jgi:hypothetical protein
MHSRSQWPRDLRRRSTAACLLRSRFRIPPGAWMFVVCQVEVSATSWSLVQRSPTDCGASLCVIKKLRGRGGHSLRWAAEPERERERNNDMRSFLKLSGLWLVVSSSKLRKATTSLFMSVSLHAITGPYYTNFHEIWCLRIFRKFVNKVSLKSDKNDWYITWRPVYINGSTSMNSSYGEKCFRHKL